MERKLKVIASIGIISALCLSFIAWAFLSNSRPGNIYIINKNGNKYIKIIYGVEGSSVLPIANGKTVVEFPDSGIIYTSSMPEKGYGYDEFYYRDGNLLVKIQEKKITNIKISTIIDSIGLLPKGKCSWSAVLED